MDENFDQMQELPPWTELPSLVLNKILDNLCEKDVKAVQQTSPHFWEEASRALQKRKHFVIKSRSELHNHLLQVKQQPRGILVSRLKVLDEFLRDENFSDLLSYIRSEIDTFHVVLTSRNYINEVQMVFEELSSWGKGLRNLLIDTDLPSTILIRDIVLNLPAFPQLTSFKSEILFTVPELCRAFPNVEQLDVHLKNKENSIVKNMPKLKQLRINVDNGLNPIVFKDLTRAKLDLEELTFYHSRLEASNFSVEIFLKTQTNLTSLGLVSSVQEAPRVFPLKLDKLLTLHVTKAYVPMNDFKDMLRSIPKCKVLFLDFRRGQESRTDIPDNIAEDIPKGLQTLMINWLSRSSFAKIWNSTRFLISSLVILDCNDGLLKEVFSCELTIKSLTVLEQRKGSLRLSSLWKQSENSLRDIESLSIRILGAEEESVELDFTKLPSLKEFMISGYSDSFLSSRTNLENVGFERTTDIPVSVIRGDNIFAPSDEVFMCFSRTLNEKRKRVYRNNE